MLRKRLRDADLQSLLTADGYTVTETTTAPASLAGYSAVFVGGMAVDNTLLTSYVNGGGECLPRSGHGSFAGGASGEAAAWNPFLNAFGLGLATNYNDVTGDINVLAFQGQAPYGPGLFGGVNQVYINNGNNVSVVGSNPAVQVFSTGGDGLYGAVQLSSVAESSSIVVVFGLLVLCLAWGRRRVARSAE